MEDKQSKEPIQPEEDRADQDGCSSVSSDHVIFRSVPDGGWGWMIVAAVFVVNFLIDGIAGSFGILYPVLLDAFKASPSLTSMAGATIVGTFLLSSPIVGILINKFGCRPVCFAGGCIGAVGLVLSILSKNIVAFIATYGVVGGIGLGMNCMAGHVMVNSYFNKKRGIAGGAVSSGAGFGVLVLAPALQYFLQEYGWQGTMLIMAGFMLQFCVCASLMRPFIPGNYIADNVENSGSNDDYTETSTSDGDGSDVCTTAQPLLTNKTIEFLKQENSFEISNFSSPQLAKKRSYNRPVSEHLYFSSNMSVDNASFLDAKPQDLHIINIESLPDLSDKQMYSRNVRTKQNSECGPHVRTHIHHHHRHHHRHHHCHHHLHHQQDQPHQHLDRPLLRKDIFFSGSLHHLKEYTMAKSMSSFLDAMTVKAEPVSDSTASCSETGAIVSRERPARTLLCDLSVFRNTLYIPMLLGGIFIQMAQFIPTTFIPGYGYTIGLDGGDVSLIISLYGGLNIVGRLSAGCLSNMQCMNTLWLCNFGTFICGVCCLLFPFCRTFTALCVYSSTFGYFIGYFAPLQVLIMVEYLGLDKLTSAVGFLQMFKGPAAMAGLPIAGYVYEWTGDYGRSIQFAGMLFVLASGVQSLVPLINKCSRQREKSVMTPVVLIVEPDSDAVQL